MQVNYKTKQKSAIISILRENQNRLLTADEILRLLELNKEVVGKATLYRFLDMLVLTKEVRKSYNSEINKNEYQLAMSNCNNHLHMKCMGCGIVIHLECDLTREYLDHIEREHNFKIDQYSSTIYGYCSECLKKGN